jgi:hypothetical protein
VFELAVDHYPKKKVGTSMVLTFNNLNQLTNLNNLLILISPPEFVRNFHFVGGKKFGLTLIMHNRQEERHNIRIYTMG